MRLFITLAAVIGLNGCISMDAITPSFKTESDTSYYLIDTKFRFFCEGNTKQCQDMTKIVSSRAELQPIEAVYDTPIKAPNYPVSLMHIIMNPKDGSYKAAPVGNEGRYFKVPKNEKTKVVWATLSRITEGLYPTN